MQYWNNQKYCECQLVAIWNAAIFHGIQTPERYGAEYIEDCKKGYAINGGLINPNHVLDKLGLKAVVGITSWAWIREHLPVEFRVFCHRGYHSVLAIAIDVETKRVAIANYTRGRLKWMDANELIERHNNKVPLIHWGRT